MKTDNKLQLNCHNEAAQHAKETSNDTGIGKGGDPYRDH